MTPSISEEEEGIITIINPDFRIVRISPALAETLGREPKRMVDTPVEDHLTTESIEIFCRLLDKAAKHKAPPGTTDDASLEAELTWLGEQAAVVRMPTAVSILRNDDGDWLGFVWKHREENKAIDASPEARLQMISRITSAVMQENDSRRLLSRCSEIIAAFLQATAFGSYLLTPDRQLAILQTAHGVPRTVLQKISVVPLHDSELNELFINSRILTARQLSTFDSIPGFQYRGTIALPLLSPQAAIGCMTFILPTAITETNDLFSTLRDAGRIVGNGLSRIQAEENALYAERKFQHHFQHASDVHCTINSDMELIDISASCEAIFGHDPARYIGMRLVDLPFLDEENKSRLIKHFRLKLEEKVVPRSVYEITDACGAKRKIELLSMPLRRNGKIDALSCLVRDITEAVWNTKLQRDFQQGLEDIINFLPDPTFAIDMEGRVILWNKALSDLSGTNPQEMIGRTNEEYSRIFYGHQRLMLIDLALNPPENVKQTFPFIECTGNTLAAEMYTPNLKNSGMFLWGSACPLYDLEGRKIGAIETMRDITKIKQIEAALRQSESRYRLLAENVTDIIWTMDLNWQLTYLSPSVEFLLGYEADNPSKFDIRRLIGDNTFRFLQKMLSEELANDPCQERMVGRSRTFEMEHLRKDGTKVWVEQKVSFLRDRNNVPVGLMGIARDISERMKAEEAIRISEDKFRKAFEASPDIITISTLDKGIFRDVNEAFEHKSGYRRAEVIGHSIGELNFWEDEARREEIVKQILAKQYVTDMEASFHTRNGQRLVALFSGGIIEIGGEKCLLTVLRDITELKHNDEERKKLEIQLQQAQKMEAIGRLAGGIAHDFNNLLTGIIGNIDMAMLDCPSSLMDYLNNANETARRGADLVRQLLTFSRKSQTDYRVIDPIAIFSEVNRMLRETLDKRIALKSRIDPETWPIKADATQIHQVIMNLCINAHDAIQELLESDRRRWDEFFLLIEMGNAEIDEAYCQIYPYAKPGQYMYISITDNGPGMDDKTRLHLFEPFFTTKKIGKGTGLGLATAFGIIKQHRGWINVYSRPGAGSTFRFYLPRSNEEIIAGDGSPVDMDTPGGTETILLIDDEEVIRKLGKAILERKGYTVLLGCDGRDGLEVFCREQEHIDLVILDLTMPHLSGLEVLQQINLVAPETKVIMSSGYTDQKRADKLRRLGAAGFVAKPYNIKQLAENVRQILDQDVVDKSQTA